MKNYRHLPALAVAFLAIFHLIGLTGFLTESFRPYMILLTPVNLLLAVAVLAWFHQPRTRQSAAIFAGIALAGFLIELLGVSTGVVFGQYEYLEALGPKIGGAPPMIGLNWLMLVYCAGMTVLLLPLSPLLRAVLAATLMTGLDTLMEPVVETYRFWAWAEGEAPLQNYLVWWLTAFAMSFAFQQIKGLKYNPVAPWLLLIQTIFFGLLLLLH